MNFVYIYNFVKIRINVIYPKGYINNFSKYLSKSLYTFDKKYL